MKSFNIDRVALHGLLIILALFAIFHLLILTRIIPYQIIWGGRLKNQSDMLTFESISVLVNLLMLAIVCVKAGFLKIRVNPLLIRLAFWLMFGLFLMNTLGNFTSTNEFERIVFTPVTILLSFFCLRIAVSSRTTA